MKRKIIVVFSALIILVSCAEVKETGSTVIKENSESKSMEPEKSYADYGLDMLLGKFEPSKHKDYILIDVQYADREGMYLHKDSYAAFQEMYNSASKEGIDLIIKSATRNFDYQKGIWERKWSGETKVRGEDLSVTITNPAERALKILEYSSMPGTSRHHWGTDIDLNSFNNDWFETGEGKIILDWLEENASKYGYCRPYTTKNEKRPTGYQEERWHWSYMPLANHFMELAQKQHNDNRIEGFMGANVAADIQVVKNYVFGINKACF
jgi:LAS superfamily LD-carboxypeptidase LdcB